MTRLSYFLLLSGSFIVIRIKSYNFGFNNSYICHCLNDIQCNDQTGACNNCSTQWVGPSCQQENIAYNKTANQSGQEYNQGPWFAVDSNRGTDDFIYCIDTGFSPWAWWIVDLGQSFTLRYFKTYYRSGRLSFFKGFSVHIDNELCYQHPGTSNPPAEFPIECNNTITGRYVNISNNRPGDRGHFISLCEVEIYVCSQGTYGSDCNNFCHCSNYDKCDVKTGQCPNGCQIGWDGDSCSTKCEESYSQDCSKRCTDRKCSGTSTCDHVNGECNNGCKPGYRGIDCTLECQESYGQICDKQCSDRNCLDQSSCNNINGKCIGGCKAGYRSLDCTQQRFCKINSTTCYHETGACSQDGCLDYYNGVDCTRYIGCADGYYGVGAGCKKLCSERNCRVSTATCHQVNGTCVLCGCVNGYQGHDCTIQIVPQANEGKLSQVESGIIGTVIGILVGFLIGVGVYHCWVTRKQKARVPEAYYEDISMISRQVSRDSTTVNNQTIASPQKEPQDNVSPSQVSSNVIGKSGKNRNNSSADNQQTSSDTGHNYYNIQNNTYEELDDSKKHSDNTNDYQSLK